MHADDLAARIADAMIDTGDSPNKFGKQDDRDEYSTEELRVGLAKLAPIVVAARRARVPESENNHGAARPADD